jgi:hypothetical protein
VYRSYICKPCSVPRAQLKVLWSQKTRIWRQPWNSIRFCKHPAFLHKVKNWFKKQHFSFSLILSNNNAIGSLAPFFLRSKPISRSKSLHKRICKIHEKDKIFSLPVQRVQICKRVFFVCVWEHVKVHCSANLLTYKAFQCTYWRRRFINQKENLSKEKDISCCNIWKIPNLRRKKRVIELLTSCV